MAFLAYFFSFSGRIGRMHWWLGFLASMVLPFVLATSWILSIIAAIPFAPDRSEEAAYRAWAVQLATSATVGYLVILALVTVALFVITISLNVRRYHDRDKSGWWCLLQLVPVGLFFASAASPIFLLIAIPASVIIGLWQLIELGFLAGTAGGNDFGPDPTGNLDRLAGEIDAMAGPRPPTRESRVWSGGNQYYEPATVMPVARPAPRSGPPVFGRRG